MNSVDQLLQEIAQCGVAFDGNARSVPGHPCNKIVSLQNGSNFQLPEPWSGQIDKAPVLFISSNPSISITERYPQRSWGKDEVNDFFQNRFAPPDGPAAFLKPLNMDGTRSKVVNYWAHARARTAELLEIEKRSVKPGIDFALTEIVHCKSEGETGVSEASDFCAQRFLPRVLSLSVAPVFIVYGDHAQERMRMIFSGDAEELAGDMFRSPIGGRERIIVFLPHPAGSKGPKTLLGKFNSEEIGVLRSCIAHRATL